MLIRPDACIAWTSEADSIDGLEESLRHWCSQTSMDEKILRQSS